MSKKDIKITSAAHIKRNTEGTSNELSFSVLDAAKNRADAEEGKDGKAQIPKFGKTPLFSLPIGRKKTVGTPTKENVLPLSDGSAVSATGSQPEAGGSALLGSGLRSAASSIPYSSPEDEITRRKTRRRRHRVLVALVSFLLVAGLVGGGGYYLYSELARHRENIALLDQSLQRITDSNTVCVSLDAAVNTPVDELSPDEISKILDAVPTAWQQLDEAQGLAKQAAEDMREPAGKELTDQALATTQARQEMLGLGQDLLTAALQMKSDVDAIEAAWGLVLEADAVAREAAAMVTDTTDENVSASREKTSQAEEMFNEAFYLLSLVAASPLSPDIQILLDYVTKRAEAMEYAILSDDALLAKDRESAQAHNEAYNAADAEAAAMAKNLPEEASSPAVDAYEKVTEGTFKQYMDVRLRASTADAFLRDYLGT